MGHTRNVHKGFVVVVVVIAAVVFVMLILQSLQFQNSLKYTLLDKDSHTKHHVFF